MLHKILHLPTLKYAGHGGAWKYSSLFDAQEEIHHYRRKYIVEHEDFISPYSYEPSLYGYENYRDFVFNEFEIVEVLNDNI